MISSISFAIVDDAIEVQYIFVRKKMRGNLFGVKALYKAVVHGLRHGIPYIRLDDMSDNYRQYHNIYRKLGFLYVTPDGCEMVARCSTISRACKRLLRQKAIKVDTSRNQKSMKLSSSRHWSQEKFYSRKKVTSSQKLVSQDTTQDYHDPKDLRDHQEEQDSKILDTRISNVQESNCQDTDRKKKCESQRKTGYSIFGWKLF